MTGRRESEVLAGVLSYLSTRKDMYCWRQNTGGSRFGSTYVKFGTKGAADIQCIQAPTGRFVAIEVKRQFGGRVSKDQEAWGQAVEAKGGRYIVARSVDDVEKALR